MHKGEEYVSYGLFFKKTIENHGMEIRRILYYEVFTQVESCPLKESK